MFSGCHTVQQVKTLYRQLAKQHHPDVGGSTSMMQAVNAAYHAVLEMMSGQRRTDKSGKVYTYKYNEEWERALADKVAEILQVSKPSWKIEIIGIWVWVSDTDRADKDLLNKKGCGLRWNS